MAEYICPKCKSNLVFVRWPNLECHKCGNSENLIDFPCSDTFQRHYAYHFGGIPHNTPRPDIDMVKPLTVPNVDNSRVSRLQGELVSLRDRLNKHMDYKKPNPQKKDEGLEL